MPVEGEGAPHSRSFAAELPLPEPIADHRAVCATPLSVVCGREDAAQMRLHAQHVEELATHPKPLGVARFPATSEVEDVRAPRKRAGKSLLSFADLFP